MVQKLINDWAATHRQIRRVWMSGEDLIALELEPVPDSEESFAVWMVHCRDWQGQLEARLGHNVRLAWLDPDVGRGEVGDELVYDRVGLDAPGLQ